MARFNDNQQPISFNKISIGLSSPETILAESRGEVLKPETINYRTHKPERAACFVSVFLVLSRILNVLVESTSEFVIKELFVTVVVWRLPRKKYVEIVLVTSVLLYLLHTFGISVHFPTSLVTYLVFHQRSSI